MSLISNRYKPDLNTIGFPNYVIKQYQDYYNYLRPHQGKDIGNRVRDPNAKPPPTTGIVKRKRILGGLLNHYYREAA